MFDFLKMRLAACWVCLTAPRFLVAGFSESDEARIVGYRLRRGCSVNDMAALQRLLEREIENQMGGLSALNEARNILSQND